MAEVSMGVEVVLVALVAVEKTVVLLAVKVAKVAVVGMTPASTCLGPRSGRR